MSSNHLATAARPVSSVVDKMIEPAVLGLSCYVWNWQWNLSLAREVRKRFDECLIVLGGPQVPDNSSDFFRQHPYIDVLVHGEGEATFADILRANITAEFETSRPSILESIAGISFPGVELDTHTTATRTRIDFLTELPSPYTSGVFDSILQESGHWSASQETTRGCPYSCTFCDWGSAVLTRVRHFSPERIEDEIEWFGKAGIDIVYNCDANFGMFPADLRWAHALANCRNRTGYPNQFRTSFAKKSDDLVFEIAQDLLAVGLLRGVGISLQSIDQEVLNSIKRRNLQPRRFSDLMARYRRAGIPTYTELIVGLPRETLDSFKDGIAAVLDGGQHEGLLVYPCQVLPNAELAQPKYIAAHQIETISTPLRLGYSSLLPNDVEEYIDIVISTSTMSPDDWQTAYLFGLCVQAFHCLNLTQVIAVVMRRCLDVSYRVFYEKLIHYSSTRSNRLLGQLIREASAAATRVRNGQPPGVKVGITGDSVWNPEEAMFLRAVTRKPELQTDLTDFLTTMFASEPLDNNRQMPVDRSQEVADVSPVLSDSWIQDLVNLQTASLVAPDEAQTIELELTYDFITAVSAAYDGRNAAPTGTNPVKALLVSDRPTGMNIHTYALEMLRYGRKDNHLRREIRDSARQLPTRES